MQWDSRRQCPAIRSLAAAIEKPKGRLSALEDRYCVPTATESTRDDGSETTGQLWPFYTLT